MTAKTKGIEAKRYKEKSISKRNLSSYAAMHQEKKNSKTGQNRPKSTILDRMMKNISRNFVCTNNCETTPARMNEMKRLSWSIPRSTKILLCINWNKPISQTHIFAFIPVNWSSWWKKKKSQFPRAFEIRHHIFFCEKHNIQVNWSRIFKFFANKRQNINSIKNK